ncbi:GPI mannosyltransferase 4-like [Scyliorhinus canicula]|uniref:GPI mannosyltransferase 4-like n=1 Tax=Scyliorhinus canicula TaxID=7830 RepID=UPI0018F7C78D|nr:GPI mannosyltransferase 4-like [Scyliorhinus canicula]XP_038671825.1 GPI mannosyltransferase 4-like [Scyliorhinus canicula]XP_038671826.1 GPI mannosyltransferase 4-like [Scyliorhinus canicula]
MLRMVWLALGLFRILWCLVPQTGYIHPDEFFQSPEVMAGDILNLKIFRPWEFNTSYPSRSVLFPLVTTGFSFIILKTLHNSGLFGSILNSYNLLVFPRLYVTCLSFILDYSVYRLACLWGTNPWRALILLSGSHVMLVFYTRTFSNVIEGALFALLLLLVAMDTAQEHGAPYLRAKEWRNNKHLIGIVLVSGFFNRPTFIGYALVPMLLWLSCDQKGTFQFSLRTILKRFLGIFSPVIVTTCIFIIVDTLYFDLLFSEIDWFLKDGNAGHEHIFNLCKHLVLTPFNFIRYNLDPENLSAHGRHPWFTHLTVNGLMMFGALHLSAVISAIRMITHKFVSADGCHMLKKKQLEKRLKAHFPATPPIVEYLVLVYFVPLIVLSLFSHQEARFLSPLIAPVVLHSVLNNDMLRGRTVMVVFNILCSVLFGCLHQGGLIPCLSYLEKALYSKDPVSNQLEHNLIFYHTYMPPRYLLNIRSDRESIKIIDLGGSDFSVLNDTVNGLLGNLSSKHTENNQINIYIIAPGTVEYIIKYCDFQWRTVASFFPHLSMEDPPEIPLLFSKDGLNQLSLYIFKMHKNSEL